ncbi:MAG: flavin reductase family protein [Micropruina sp.]|uniref:flavin reductase family protein n=1 Tax=Micropruina sp. TaxID=2737536 RepID=UPI0039E46923
MPKRVYTARHLAYGAVREALTDLVPRPLAWVSTRGGEAQPRLAAQSFVTLVSADPPMVGVTLFGEPQTLANIEHSHEFVVSFATADSVQRAEALLGELHPDRCEVAGGLPLEGADTVAVQRPVDSPLHMECRLHAVLNFGNGHLVVGRLTAFVVDDAAHDRADLALVGG